MGKSVVTVSMKSRMFARAIYESPAHGHGMQSAPDKYRVRPSAHRWYIYRADDQSVGQRVRRFVRSSTWFRCVLAAIRTTSSRVTLPSDPPQRCPACRGIVSKLTHGYVPRGQFQLAERCGNRAVGTCGVPLTRIFKVDSRLKGRLEI